ncbi:hypothetical protein ACFY9N_16500 [Microbacterium sp. NPDC008134]|uniref:hypothetical protein n=1 Tax=Microbacterium sp. NPDC008134 TaxID=3364183 RepID=UPI0036DFB106
MSDLQEGDGMPPGIVFAIVCGVGVVIFWGLGALSIVGFLGVSDVASAASLLACVFATGAGVIGVIGCRLRWVWVRWAALVQAVVIVAVMIPSWIQSPQSTGWIALFVAYAGLQFLPSSHRWYHPKPHVPGSPVPIPGVHS